MSCTNTPREHQLHTHDSAERTLCSSYHSAAQRGREPAAKSSGQHSTLRHKDNWQEKKERESFITKNQKKKKKKKDEEWLIHLLETFSIWNTPVFLLYSLFSIAFFSPHQLHFQGERKK